MNKIDEVNLMDQIVGKENPNDKPLSSAWYSPDGITWTEVSGSDFQPRTLIDDAIVYQYLSDETKGKN